MTGIDTFLPPPTYADLATLQWATEENGHQIVVVDTRLDQHEPPVLELSPWDALALGADLIGLAREAIDARNQSAAEVAQVIDTPADLGPILRRLRHDQLLSAAALAHEIDSRDATIISAELGTRHPRLPLLLRLLDALGARLTVVKR